MKISIVIPCYNEQEAIPYFYREINKISKKMKEEFEKLGENINVTILKTRGLNSFYADKAGIIISY